MVDYTLAIVGIGAVIIGAVAGSLGSFAVLRKQSLLGDCIAHAALPGIAIAFLLTLTKSPLLLILGAALSGWIGTLLIMLITSQTRVKEDAALGIVLSVFFGFGILLLTFIQNIPQASQSGLTTFLFGNAASLLRREVVLMGIIGGVILFLLVLFWKEFKLLTFDKDYARTLGFNIRFLDILLMSLIVVAIVLGLQTVGVVLMSAMVIAPAAAARQWTDKLGVMVILAGIFGAVSGVVGAILSSSIAKLPTGPTIVVVLSAVVTISLLFSPHRGILLDAIKHVRNRQRLAVNKTLVLLYNLSKSHSNPSHPHDLDFLKSIVTTNVEQSLQLLAKEKLVSWRGSEVSLTALGLRYAKELEESL